MFHTCVSLSTWIYHKYKHLFSWKCAGKVQGSLLLSFAPACGLTQSVVPGLSRWRRCRPRWRSRPGLPKSRWSLCWKTAKSRRTRARCSTRENKSASQIWPTSRRSLIFVKTACVCCSASHGGSTRWFEQSHLDRNNFVMVMFFGQYFSSWQRHNFV